MQLPADRHLGAWSGAFPTALVHLPSGLGLKVSTYSARAGAYDDHRDSSTVRLLEKTPDLQRLQVEHAGSVVAVDVVHDGPGRAVVRLRLVEPGEWALRFWMLVEVGRLDAPTAPALDGVPGSRTRIAVDRPEAWSSPTGRVAASWRSTHLAVHTVPEPARVGTYDDLDQLRAELAAGGYYLPHDDADDPRWAVLRFSAQEQSEVVAGVAFHTSASEASEAADRLLDRAPQLLERVDGHADADAALAAVRDVVGWNTVWDAANGRPYTALTRNWLGEKFGGYGIWLNDVAYGALLAAVTGDPLVARADLETVVAGQQPDGNLPCLLTANEEWVDRSQPPIVGFLLRRVHAATGDRATVRALLPALRRNLDWWHRVRDGDGDGLIEYGSTPTGHGTFRHTRQGAMNEASMDNLPMFDGIAFDQESATLMVADPGLNSLLVLEAESLAALHAELGDHAAAEELAATAAAHAARIREGLWDEARGVFAARRWDGTFVETLSPTSFYPLIAGVASPEQAATLVRDHLLDPARFWGPRPIPASPYDAPASADRVYWRGRVWPPMVYLTWEGLRRYGFDAEARELADRAWAMFADGWADRRCLENLDPDGPDGDHGPDVDDFYTWGALLPLVAHLERADASPWHGTRLDATEGPVRVWADGVELALRPADGGFDLTAGDRLLGRLDGAAALSGLRVAPGTLRLAVPEGGPAARFTPAGGSVAVQRGDRVGPAEDVVDLRPGEPVTLLGPAARRS